MTDSQKILRMEDFEEFVGETFIFSIEGVQQKVEGTLTRITKLSSGNQQEESGTRESFTLDFKFLPEANIGQCLFQVETAGGIPFPPMFLVPRRGDESGWYMDTLFN